MGGGPCNWNSTLQLVDELNVVRFLGDLGMDIQTWVVGSNILLIFTPKLAGDEPILTGIFFSKGLKPPTS